MVLEQVNIDFQVLDTRDPRYLSIADYSVWGQIEGKPSIVEILLPGESKPIVQYFDKGRINVFTSIMLNLNCPTCDDELVDLPDGVYEITVKGSPDKFNFTRKYLRTTATQLEWDKMYINLNLLCKNKNIDSLNLLKDIRMLLRTAESNTRYDNICEAQELLFEAQRLIEKAKGCAECVDV